MSRFFLHKEDQIELHKGVGAVFTGRVATNPTGAKRRRGFIERQVCAEDLEAT